MDLGTVGSKGSSLKDWFARIGLDLNVRRPNISVGQLDEVGAILTVWGSLPDG